MAPNDASVRALNRLTDMKHLEAAFFHTGSGALSSGPVILRGKLIWLRSGFIHHRAHDANPSLLYNPKDRFW
jgi:hypothetical protein